MKNLVKDIDINTINISRYVGDTKIIDKDATLGNYITDMLINTGLNENVATKVVSDKILDNLIKNFAVDIIISSMHNKEMPKVSSVEMLNTLSDNGFKFSAKEEEIIKKGISDFNKTITLPIPQKNIFMDYTINDLSHIIFGTTLKIFFIVAIVSIFLIIVLINWNFKKSLIYTIIPILINAFLWLGLFIFTFFALKSSSYNNYHFIIKNISYKFLFIAISEFLIGMTLIIKYKFKKSN